VHGTLTWGTQCYAEQRPLDRRFRLLVPDRRGFGASPDVDDPKWTSDRPVDAEDVLGLLSEARAHLVGHSYGGVVAMLAAAARPDLVQSLTLIEPSTHMAAIDDPTVAAAVESSRAFMAGARLATPADYLRLDFDDAGCPARAGRPAEPGRPHRARRAPQLAGRHPDRPTGGGDLPQAGHHGRVGRRSAGLPTRHRRGAATGRSHGRRQNQSRSSRHPRRRPGATPRSPSPGERPAHRHVDRLERRPTSQSIDGSAGLAGDEVKVWITALR
jgi:pimeloyl-ACP methyl ester carboxylesterase